MPFTSVSFYKSAEEAKHRGSSLEKIVSGRLNLTWALAQLGRLTEAIELTSEAVLDSAHLSNLETKIRCFVHHGYILYLSGESRESMSNFQHADYMQRDAGSGNSGLSGTAAIWWAERVASPENVTKKRTHMPRQFGCVLTPLESVAGHALELRATPTFSTTNIPTADASLVSTFATLCPDRNQPEELSYPIGPEQNHK